MQDKLGGGKLLEYYYKLKTGPLIRWRWKLDVKMRVYNENEGIYSALLYYIFTL